MTQPKTDEKMALNQVGQLHRLLSFEPDVLPAMIKNHGASTGLNKSLIAIGMAFGLAFVGNAQAAKIAVIDSPVDARKPIEKRDSLKNIANPHHSPPAIDTRERNKASDGASFRQNRFKEVPAIDQAKNPAEPLAPGSKDIEAVEAVKKLQIVDANGKLHPVYLSYLRHFDEKPFSEIKDLGKILRFVLIESSRKPILITVNFKTKNAGTTTLCAKQLGKDFKLDKNKTIELTPEQSQSLTEKIEYPELWKEVPYTKTPGNYSYWILETWDRKKYQSATEFLPKDGLIKELGEELLSLTDLRPPDSTKP